jgi:hypothetical protein
MTCVAILLEIYEALFEPCFLELLIWVSLKTYYKIPGRLDKPNINRDVSMKEISEYEIFHIGFQYGYSSDILFTQSLQWNW